MFSARADIGVGAAASLEGDVGQGMSMGVGKGGIPCNFNFAQWCASFGGGRCNIVYGNQHRNGGRSGTDWAQQAGGGEEHENEGRRSDRQGADVVMRTSSCEQAPYYPKIIDD